jgi:tryptophanyl-tRNA synthetase
MKRVLSALQPSGFLHIGNYFGMIEPALSLQEQNQNFIFIVDYHAITVPQDPKKLKEQILFALAVYLASGIDPQKTIIFQQSSVCEHTELGWILNCLTSMGELERMTQFKDKAKNKGQNVSVGLFDYPILMAADILLYDTNIVPVGEDQKQHVELTRDIAQRFNQRYGETFTIPQPQIRNHGARIMGLDNPEKKMSKSAESCKNYISLLDDEKTIQQKIMGAVTDSGKEIRYDQTHLGLANLLTIYSLVTQTSFEQIQKDFEGKGYGDFKKKLAEALILFLHPLQEKIRGFLADEEELKRILKQGGQQAKELAQQKMQIVRKKIGVTL